MTGFAAACYQRGVDFIQVPTTLLSQVDSSVGGKTGVNHPLGKNMIGAFHQPRAVLAATDLLATLPERELSAGLAEVIKYGLIHDAEFFAWLEGSMPALRAREPEALAYAIHRSCTIKAAIVARDERESGVRDTAESRPRLWPRHPRPIRGMAAGCTGKRSAWGADGGQPFRPPGVVELGRADPHRAGVAGGGVAARAAGVDEPQAVYGADGGGQKGDRRHLRLVLLKRIGQGVVSADFPPQALQQTLICGQTLGQVG